MSANDSPFESSTDLRIPEAGLARDINPRRENYDGEHVHGFSPAMIVTASYAFSNVRPSHVCLGQRRSVSGSFAAAADEQEKQ
jgi:hypothetical protein